MEDENKRQVHAQSDGGGGEGVAANHPAPVRDRIATQSELHGEPGHRVAKQPDAPGLKPKIMGNVVTRRPVEAFGAQATRLERRRSPD